MSKLIMYEWRCLSCDTKFDQLAKPDVKITSCPNCSASAKRLLSAGHLDPKMGLDPDMPTSYDKWERVNKQKIEEDRKFHKEHGADKKHHSYGS